MMIQYGMVWYGMVCYGIFYSIPSSLDKQAMQWIEVIEVSGEKLETGKQKIIEHEHEHV